MVGTDVWILFGNKMGFLRHFLAKSRTFFVAMMVGAVVLLIVPIIASLWIFVQMDGEDLAKYGYFSLWDYWRFGGLVIMGITTLLFSTKITGFHLILLAFIWRVLDAFIPWELAWLIVLACWLAGYILMDKLEEGKREKWQEIEKRSKNVNNG